MISVFASSAIDRAMIRGRVKPKTIKLVLVASPLSMQHEGKRAKTGWLGIRIMCPRGATCLPAYCCFSELALRKSNSASWSRTKQTSSSSHQNVTRSRHDKSLKLLIWR
jgi:hypothetical protein